MADANGLLEILLAGRLDEQRTVTNITSQLDSISKKLKAINVTLDISDLKKQFQQLFGEIENKSKKTSKQKLEFDGIDQTREKIRDLSTGLESLYKDLKQLGNVKSLKELYDGSGNFKGFNVELEAMKGKLKEISNYNAIGKFNEETQEWEYALTRISSKLTEVKQKANEGSKASTQSNANAFYDSVMQKVAQYKTKLMDLNTFIKQVEGQMFKKDGTYTSQFLKLDDAKRIQLVRELDNAIKLRNKALQEEGKINNALLSQEEKRRVALLNQSLVIQKMKDSLNTTNTKYNASGTTDITGIQAMINSISQLNPLATDYAVRLREIQYAVGQFNRGMIESARNTNLESKAMADQQLVIQKLQDKLTSIKNQYGVFASNNTASGLQQSINELAQLDPRTVEYRNRVNQLRYDMQRFGETSRDAFRRSQDAISDTTAKTSALGLAMRTLGQFFMIGSPIFLANRMFRDMTSTLNDMNKALTDIRVVTGMTSEETENLGVQYNNLAKQLGATTQDVLKGSVEWFRQGKTIEETQELLKASITMAKLAGISSSESTQYLTSVLNGYQMSAEKAMSVTDKLVAVDNAAATSVNELAVALQRSSNSASMAGVGLDQLVGYIGTVSSVSRKSAETIGESFKTIFSRLYLLKNKQNFVSFAQIV